MEGSIVVRVFSPVVAAPFFVVIDLGPPNLLTAIVETSEYVSVSWQC